MPPTAAIVEQIANTASLIPATLMPARRAASALPPTAYTWRPKRVRWSTNVQTTYVTSIASVTHGRPRSELATITTTSAAIPSTTIRAITNGIGWLERPAARLRVTVDNCWNAYT